jgi:hypothetical protein
MRLIRQLRIPIGYVALFVLAVIAIFTTYALAPNDHALPRKGTRDLWNWIGHFALQPGDNFYDSEPSRFPDVGIVTYHVAQSAWTVPENRKIVFAALRKCRDDIGPAFREQRTVAYLETADGRTTMAPFRPKWVVLKFCIHETQQRPGRGNEQPAEAPPPPFTRRTNLSPICFRQKSCLPTTSTSTSFSTRHFAANVAGIGINPRKLHANGCNSISSPLQKNTAKTFPIDGRDWAFAIAARCDRQRCPSPNTMPTFTRVTPA